MWHLIRVNTVRLPRADLDPRAEILAWNRLLMGLFWLKLCSNGSKRGWIRFWPAGLNWHFGVETDLLIFNARLGNELVQSYQKTNEQALWPSEISDTDQTFEKKKSLSKQTDPYATTEAGKRKTWTRRTKSAKKPIQSTFNWVGWFFIYIRNISYWLKLLITVQEGAFKWACEKYIRKIKLFI